MFGGAAAELRRRVLGEAAVAVYIVYDDETDAAAGSGRGTAPCVHFTHPSI